MGGGEACPPGRVPFLCVRCCPTTSRILPAENKSPSKVAGVPKTSFFKVTPPHPQTAAFQATHRLNQAPFVSRRPRGSGLEKRTFSETHREAKAGSEGTFLLLRCIDKRPGPPGPARRGGLQQGPPNRLPFPELATKTGRANPPPLLGPHLPNICQKRIPGLWKEWSRDG